MQTHREEAQGRASAAHHDDRRPPLKRKMTSHGENPMPRKRHVSDKIDYILLSFFDGIASAGLVCDEIISQKQQRWKGFAWETDKDLMSLSEEKFPQMQRRGDIDADDPASLISALRAIDPSSNATIIVAAGAPCRDYSRIRANAPGVSGDEGRKFLRFADFLKELEASWSYAQAILIVENVVPDSKRDVKFFEEKLSAQAVICDLVDLGVTSRPRVWWTRLPWQELSNRKDLPTRLRWSTYFGVPKVTFEQPKDNLDSYDLGNLRWPANVAKQIRPLPCLTTPADDPAGRPAPRSCRGKVDSQTQSRWLDDNRRYAPWHYEEDNMFVDTRDHQRLTLATAEIKEQLHHLPVGWTSRLRDHGRHKAIANGWRLGIAKWFFIFGIFCAQVPSPHPAIVLESPRWQPLPLGSSAIATMATLWVSAPLLNGPGVPIFDDALDLSAIDNMMEHWQASQTALHPGQSAPCLEPGLAQWLPLWQHWRPHLPTLRQPVAEVVQLVEDHQGEVLRWHATLEPHVQAAYSGKSGKCTMQLPIIVALAAQFGWGDMALFEEMQNGFPLLGTVRPGLGWRLRSDARYATPKDLAAFFVENHDFVQQRLRRGKVDPCWQAMAEEIAADVAIGRMEGPFEAPASWCKQAVPLPMFAHTAKLLPAPSGQAPCSFAFAVHQVGSNGNEKIRRAEDWRRSGANATVGVPDTPAYHGIDAFIHLARALRRVSKQHGLQLWGLDHEAAYRQLPVENPCHTYVILNTPQGPTLWRHNVLMFGSAASVWSYCRVADFMCWLVRCMLLAPLLHFVDDFGAVRRRSWPTAGFSAQRRCAVRWA